ncbi:hypothetical protein VOLCADRAFT_98600 [Volvox carteri f. nagariensis]|uniref:Uncharacterized protein n=1 Tax=Volvox carteri f. nagariensis TaxID=3068 RepID=D8UFS4_VOLCA|nr:uncharacterized protein VOLCADRAFT_98600 [Volvox carteri f. nagariensis]EFJ41387.1 hypothetical protein VOLCADRAFT_98600 [Volvox carteri f. nagariensis]|eukprot:XP_002957493.1 hypothetical protein VOLCADRAFT_98600 [Volvox carteri f. nagariensis]
MGSNQIPALSSGALIARCRTTMDVVGPTAAGLHGREGPPSLPTECSTPLRGRAVQKAVVMGDKVTETGGLLPALACGAGLYLVFSRGVMVVVEEVEEVVAAESLVGARRVDGEWVSSVPQPRVAINLRLHLVLLSAQLFPGDGDDPSASVTLITCLEESSTLTSPPAAHVGDAAIGGDGFLCLTDKADRNGCLVSIKA